jgi:hypothetical protein
MSCCLYQDPQGDILDVIYKTSTVFIAACNVAFAVWIFYTKSKRDGRDRERDRKIDLLKVLVLDHNLKHFYKTFDDLEVELQLLRQNNLTLEQKEGLEGRVSDLFIFLRRNFIDSLFAIDRPLYDNIMTHSDDLQGRLSHTIFDEGINLAHPPRYEEEISEKLTEAKTNILRILFTYRG